MKDYRKKFHFQIGTTSYIIPIPEDNLTANVNYLKNSFDQVQLLFFGKDYLDELLTVSNVESLLQIQKKTGLEYVIHLPIDLGLLEADDEILPQRFQAIRRIIYDTKRIKISAFILHIDFLCGNKTRVENHPDYYRKRFQTVLNRLEKDFPELGENCAIENTHYDLLLFSDLILQSRFSICMDIGHLYRLGLPLKPFIQAFGNRIHAVHLHGIRGKKDHQSLTVTSKRRLKEIFTFLKSYQKALIVEVFNEGDLTGSMELLEGNIR